MLLGYDLQKLKKKIVCLRLRTAVKNMLSEETAFTFVNAQNAQYSFLLTDFFPAKFKSFIFIEKFLLNFAHSTGRRSINVTEIQNSTERY